MIRIFIVTCFLLLSSFLSAQPTREKLEKLLPGTWKMENPADAKMTASAGEDFLKVVIAFDSNAYFRIPGEKHNWTWNVETDTSIVILDTDKYDGVEYTVQEISDTELVILFGKSGLRYTRTK